MEDVLKGFTKTLAQLENKMKGAINNIPSEHNERANELLMQMNASMKVVRSGDVTAINELINKSKENLKNANTDNK